MKYAHIDDNNKILGWYDTEIHTTIPTPNTEVTDEVWQEAININANYYNAETKSFEYKDFRAPEELEEQRVYQIRAKANEIISAKYPDYKQRSGAMGVYGDDYYTEMKAFISGIIEQSNTLEADTTKTADDFVV
jgi:hypothetical protein